MIILNPKSLASPTAQAGAALCSAWIIAFQQSLHTLKSLNALHSFAVLNTPESLRVCDDLLTPVMLVIIYEAHGRGVLAFSRC